jgi:starvation-inducible DNA-binding protein
MIWRRAAGLPVRTPSDISPKEVKDISGALDAVLADVFACLFEDTELSLAHGWSPTFGTAILLDEQGNQIVAITDDIADVCESRWDQ